MEKDNIQKELFEFEQPRKQPKRFGQFFQKADFGLTLNQEKLVFASIGIVMLLVVAFALGVERGKAISYDQQEEKVVKKAQPVVQPVVKQVTQAKPANAPTVAVPAAMKKTQVPLQGAVQPKATDDKTKPYTIVAAAFSKEQAATGEVSRLKSGGIDAFIYRSDPYYLVCVGAFANKDSAQKTLAKVRQMRRDAYVRLK